MFKNKLKVMIKNFIVIIKLKIIKIVLKLEL